IDRDIPLPVPEGVELSITIAGQLFDFLRQLARMGLAAVEHGDFMAALECVANLKRPGKAGAAENQNAERLGFPGGARARKNSQTEGSPGHSRDLDKTSSGGRCHAAESMAAIFVKRNRVTLTLILT